MEIPSINYTPFLNSESATFTNKDQSLSTIEKITKVVLMIFSALTVVGIPLALHLWSTMESEEYSDVLDAAFGGGEIPADLSEIIMPKMEHVIENKASYYFSNSFQYKGRTFRAMYVGIGDEVQKNLILFDEAQAIWRVLPRRSEGLAKNAYDLPISVQLKLNQHANESPIPFPMDKAYKPSILLGEKERLVHSSRIETNRYLGTGESEKMHPEDLEPRNYFTKPDFESAYDPIPIQSSQYPGALGRIVPSIDNTLHYFFIEHGTQVFLATVEKIDSEISHSGNHKEYFDVGDLNTPLHVKRNRLPEQYREQEPLDLHSKTMSSSHYLNQIPMIQEYRNQFLGVLS